MTNGTFNVLGSAYTLCPVAQGHHRQLERERRERELDRYVAAVAPLVCGASFTSCTQMETTACQRVVEQFGRALSESEHARVIQASRALWDAAHPVTVYQLTDLGREALAECVDCFELAEPDSMMCADCRAKHVTPDRSDLRITDIEAA